MRLGLWFVKLWLRTLASTAIILGLRGRAQELYERMARLDPDDLLVRSTLGNMYMEQGEGARAIDQFLLLLERHPKHAESWFNLAYIYEQREQLADAERCFRRAVELNPKIDRAWYGLGLVLIREERLTDAVAALKENTRLQPFSPYGWYQLAMTYHHLGESGEAWRTYEHLKTFEPRYAATLKRDLENTRSRAANGPASASLDVQLSEEEELAARP